MKESLRRLQWCPHRRTTLSFDAPGPPALVETVGGSNAYTAGPIGSEQVEIGTCIGHQCSQWRWDRSLVLDVVTPGAAVAAWVRGDDGSLWQVEPLPRPPGVDASWTWRPVLGRWDKLVEVLDRDGHCGLSGDATYD